MEDIIFTEAAMEQIRKVIEQEGGQALRLFITGGGCSGFQYGFAIEQGDAKEDDVVFVDENAQVYVDAASLERLMGATVDYVSTTFDSRFVVNNPNATAQCGCGTSFSV